MPEKTKNTEMQCPVCLLNFISTTNILCITPCNHEFLKDCIIQSILHSIRNRNRTVCSFCWTDIKVCDIKINGVPLIERQLKTIYGSIYIQGTEIGLTSYPFESEEDCYISYSSQNCSVWLPLDDGSRPPEKKTIWKHGLWFRNSNI